MRLCSGQMLVPQKQSKCLKQNRLRVFIFVSFLSFEILLWAVFGSFRGVHAFVKTKLHASFSIVLVQI